MKHNFDRARELERKVIISTFAIDTAKDTEDKLKKTQTALIHTLALVTEYEDIFKALAGNFDSAVTDLADFVKENRN